MNKIIVLKLGGSVITKKREGKAEVNEKNLNRLAREIAQAKRQEKFRLVLVHGAGPFGHVPAKKYGLDKGLMDKKQIGGFSITHQSMEKLNFAVIEALRREGLNAIAYQPSAVGILKNGRLKFFPVDVIKKLLDIDMIPVAYGDVLVDEISGIGILSGDHLVPYLAESLKADRVIITTDVPGIYALDPKKNSNAKIIREINLDNIKLIRLGNSTATDVTGGMKKKVLELLRLAENGIESEVISALKPGNLKRSLLGEIGIGTIIKK